MPRNTNRTLGTAVDIAVFVVLGLFILQITQMAMGIPSLSWGIRPRELLGLRGILFSPLLHAGWGHLFANALPLFLLLILLLADHHYYPYRTLCILWLASGAGTWLIGRGESVHTGASGIIFGLAAYLIAAGLIMRSGRSALIAAIVLLLFGGMFYGVLPHPGRISWEAHLSGAIAGVWAARRNHGSGS